MILTYAPAEDFTPLCQTLSARLETLGAPNAALLCAICAVDIGTLLRLGLDRPVHGVRANLSVVEALLILCSMVTPADIALPENAVMVASKLAELCLQLQDQGMTSVTGFLQTLRAAPTAKPFLTAIAEIAPELLPGYVISAPQPAPQPVAQAPVTAQALFSAPVAPIAPVMAPAAPAAPAFRPAPAMAPQPQLTAPVMAPVAPKPFMPVAPQPVMPQPVAPAPMVPTPAPVERPRPVPFMPVAAATPAPMPMMMTTAMPAPAPAPAPEPEPEPEVEYEYVYEFDHHH